MAETAPTWLLLQRIADRLTEIRSDRGYRTDIGTSVALEPAQHPDEVAIGLTLASLGIQRDANKPHGRHRLLQGLAEATLPASLADAHAQCHAIAADIEDALDDWIPLPNALPVQVEDIVFLDRPEGLPVVAVQVALTVRYRR
ncbi:hypothetical protein [Lysobacter sp. Root690]|uniref:hypothetical protein n=1 Tax=Lysobacter sp. Root690 TaxID=1736588 RepID=UPI0006FFA32E|nr:hypothetical protein [Lysobacter sp. Root690]KRB08032.1 hypothetical protein ASD86_09555 [Lysobacter sp. Root690]